MTEYRHICGTCAHHVPSGGDWSCGNEDSDAYGNYTMFDDECEDWESRL